MTRRPHIHHVYAPPRKGVFISRLLTTPHDAKSIMQPTLLQEVRLAKK